MIGIWLLVFIMSGLMAYDALRHDDQAPGAFFLVMAGIGLGEFIWAAIS